MRTLRGVFIFVVVAVAAVLLVASPGSGAEPTPPLKPSPQDLIFNDTTVGATRTKTVTLTNTTVSSITVSKLLIYGFNKSEFNVGADTCTNKPVAATATCAFDVVFTPADVGTRVAHLRVDSNAACPTWLTLAGGGQTPTERQASTCPAATATATPSPVATTVGSPTPTPTPTPAGGVAGFTQTGVNSACPGRTKVRINFHTNVHTRLKLKGATVKVGGRTFKVKRNKNRLHKVRGYYFSILQFKGLTAPRYKVKVRGTLTNGHPFVRNRVFKNCISSA